MTGTGRMGNQLRRKGRDGDRRAEKATSEILRSEVGHGLGESLALATWNVRGDMHVRPSKLHGGAVALGGAVGERRRMPRAMRPNLATIP
eukprot:5042688-Pyramimonas_sp.AAC.1